MSEQAEQLERVSDRIGALVLEFCSSHLGLRFFAEELTDYVRGRAESPVAPDSACRILRALRKAGRLDYVVVSRSQSLYRVTAVVG